MARRAFAAILVLAGAAALLLAPPARAETAWFVGAWGMIYARYNPVQFGPEKPLRGLLQDLGIALDGEGKLDGARLLVIKDGRRCELWRGELMIKAYRIQLSQHPRGTKSRRYDQRTPEGDYAICAHRPSKYHRGLWINYPSLEDADRGLQARRIGEAERARIADALARGECPPQNTRLGGLVMFHGQQRSLTRSLARSRHKGKGRARTDFVAGDADPATMRDYHDWTAGCIAMFNPDIRELYDLLPNGTPVRIVATGQVTRPR